MYMYIIYIVYVYIEAILANSMNIRALKCKYIGYIWPYLSI